MTKATGTREDREPTRLWRPAPEAPQDHPGTRAALPPVPGQGTGEDRHHRDHVVPIAKGGAIYDIANMQPVCADCREAKTRRE